MTARVAKRQTASRVGGLREATLSIRAVWSCELCRDSGHAEELIKVAYTTRDGQAKGSETCKACDYISTRGLLEFAPGVEEQEIVVKVSEWRRSCLRCQAPIEALHSTA